MDSKPKLLIEPFAGGGIVGLTAAVEKLVKKVLLCELDDDVAAVWQTILQGSGADVTWLCKQILSFEVTEDNVRAALAKADGSTRQRAFQTIIKNRMQRGGILAKGASLMKGGENGKGLKSRWYPETLVSRIRTISKHKKQIEFKQQDAFEVIKQFGGKSTKQAWFIDPPYTAGGKSAGSRLYTHNVLDHASLFSAMKATKGEFMMSYDNAEEVQKLAKKNGFATKLVPMKNTHHEILNELLVFRA